jgi:hypothetical protein
MNPAVSQQLNEQMTESLVGTTVHCGNVDRLPLKMVSSIPTSALLLMNGGIRYIDVIVIYVGI